MKKKSTAFLLICLIMAVVVPAAYAQETEVERLLARGDSFFEKSEYKLAVGSYLEAAALSTKSTNQSRAYFGLSLCFFYERDMAESVKWLRKISLVDPDKEISADFYPKPFVDLFTQVLQEARTKGTPAVADAPKQVPPARIKLAEPAKTFETPVSQAEIPASRGLLDGRLELSVHYSDWSINLVKGIFENTLKDELGEAIQNEINKKIGKTYAGLVKGAFTPDLAFDSEGSNYGLELRYYVRGWAGTFSLGLSLEQTNLKLTLLGTAKQDFTNGSRAEAQASAVIETKPFSTNFSFRWEIGSAEARIKPFFTFGFGLAPLKGTFSYAYNGTYTLGQAQESIEDAQTKTFPELSEDIDFKIPELLVIVQVHFGVKVELFKGLFILGEAGLWDGLLLRGGLGFRF